MPARAEVPSLALRLAASPAANHLYLRVTNLGNVGASATRLRLLRVDLAATPIAATPIANAVADIATGPPQVQEFTWNPGGAPGRTELVLAVADQDLPGRRVDLPASFASPAQVAAFAERRPSVVLRGFEVVAP
ncbi:MAG TPA: hypothetical protein VFA46_21225 [Actinomycetes bacterium]|nr:hypothetical protein [Actinomycetes bacterium]